VTCEGIGNDPEKVAAIAELEPPSTVKELRQYLGVASWYRRLVPDFSRIVKPLNDLLRKGSKWEFTPEHQMAFEEAYRDERAYRKGQLKVVADAFSRQPLPETLRGLKQASATIASGGCSWIKDMGKKTRTQPQKYPDYVMDGETLYRNITHRAGSEDVASWKTCVPKSLRETVLRENHDAPSAGHVGSRRTIARLVDRYYW